MDFELVFSLAGLIAMAGWAALVLSPWIPLWSDRLAGVILPGLLSAGYVALLFFFPADQGGGFGSFVEVVQLFSSPHALMAGWVHFLAFDLLVGAWICRDARARGLAFGWVLPSLPVTFLFGPAGFLLYLALRTGQRAIGLRTPAT